MSRIYGFSHVATITSDLDRFLDFYVGELGLEHLVTMEMADGPKLRHAFVAVEPGCGIHVFEQPGYDPAGAGIPNEIGRRGRIDHFGLMVADRTELETMRDRLVTAGASDGRITALGPVLSVHFVDPDGLHAEINCPNAVFEADPGYAESRIEAIDPNWISTVAAKVPSPAH